MTTGFLLDPAPPGEPSAWRLAGDLDFGCVPDLEPALRSTVGDPWLLDVSGLSFVDVAVMRVIATLARESAGVVELRHAPAFLQRLWRLAGFDELAPTVSFPG
ncbi:MAG TPA: STAS domain-containing protein [Nocardioides sp.]|nr:STAS domain-containing protein [Nocardioides sp.]